MLNKLITKLRVQARSVPSKSFKPGDIIKCEDPSHTPDLERGRAYRVIRYNEIAETEVFIETLGGKPVATNSFRQTRFLLT